MMILSSASENTWRLDPAREMERSSESVVALGKLKSVTEILLEVLLLGFVATTLLGLVGEAG